MYRRIDGNMLITEVGFVLEVTYQPLQADKS